MSINSFNEAKTRYETTKPVVSKAHWRKDDIRPINPWRRDRKWERIVKVSRNCYALCGGHMHTGVSFWGDRTEPDPLYTPDLIKRTAPIVWERRRDGHDYVTIHFAAYSHANSWFSFLREWLPHSFHLRYAKSRRLDSVEVRGEEHYLPLNKYFPADLKRQHYIENNQLGHTPKYEKKLTFRMAAGEPPVLVSEPFTRKQTGTRVNTKAKAAYLDTLRQVRDWVATMRPIMADTWVAKYPSFDYRTMRDNPAAKAAHDQRVSDYRTKFQQIQKAQHELLGQVADALGVTAGQSRSLMVLARRYGVEHPGVALHRVVGQDPDHIFWFAFLVHVLQSDSSEEGGGRGLKPQLREQRFWSRYNRSLNEMLGFIQQ